MKKYMKGKTLKQYIKEQMMDDEFEQAWNELEPEFELLKSLISLREQLGVTQEELASRIGTKQSAISRLEQGAIARTKMETLKKIADALGVKLVVKLEPKTQT
jgi:ribosome-binding protein aMBF1 (putative translation factor)